MNTTVTIKLTVPQVNLVVESLETRQEMMEKHGRLPAEGPMGSDARKESHALRQESRRKALELSDILAILKS